MKNEQDREEHMSKMEAVGIFLQLANKRTTTRDEVVAIQVACRSTLKRFFDRERWFKLKHGAEADENIPPKVEPEVTA